MNYNMEKIEEAFRNNMLNQVIEYDQLLSILSQDKTQTENILKIKALIKIYMNMANNANEIVHDYLEGENNK